MVLVASIRQDPARTIRAIELNHSSIPEDSIFCGWTKWVQPPEHRFGDARRGARYLWIMAPAANYGRAFHAILGDIGARDAARARHRF